MASTIQLPLTPEELASTVEALHDAILRRLKWSVCKEFTSTWRELLDLGDAQTILNTMVSSYAKGMMAFKEGEFPKSPEYEPSFSLPEEAWDLLASVTTAERWSDIPYHPDHDPDECPLCDKFER